MTSRLVVNVASTALLAAIALPSSTAFAFDCENILKNNAYVCAVKTSLGNEAVTKIRFVNPSKKDDKQFDAIYYVQGEEKNYSHKYGTWGEKKKEEAVKDVRTAACQCKARIGQRNWVSFDPGDRNEFHCVTDDGGMELAFEGSAELKREKYKHGHEWKWRWTSVIDDGQAVDYRGVSFVFDCKQLNRRANW